MHVPDHPVCVLQVVALCLVMAPGPPTSTSRLLRQVPRIDFVRDEAISRMRERGGRGRGLVAYLSHGNTLLQHENLDDSREMLFPRPCW